MEESREEKQRVGDIFSYELETYQREQQKDVHRGRNPAPKWRPLSSQEMLQGTKVGREVAACFEPNRKISPSHFKEAEF